MQPLNWLCFDCMFISTEDLAHFISIFSLVSRFVLFLAAPALRVRRAWNLMGISVWTGQEFFILFGKKYYFIQKLKFSYYNNLLENVFQTSRVIGLITLLYAKLDAKKVFQILEKVFPSQAFHWKPGFNNFRVTSMS